MPLITTTLSKAKFNPKNACSIRISYCSSDQNGNHRWRSKNSIPHSLSLFVSNPSLISLRVALILMTCCHLYAPWRIKFVDICMYMRMYLYTHTHVYRFCLYISLFSFLLIIAYRCCLLCFFLDTCYFEYMNKL